MRWVLLGVLTALMPGVWGAPSPKIQEQVRQIDSEIEELKDMKRGFEGRAIRAENQADRLQFEDKFVLETRRYYQVAEENREKAERVQEEIDRLEARKAELLKNG